MYLTPNTAWLEYSDILCDSKLKGSESHFSVLPEQNGQSSFLDCSFPRLVTMEKAELSAFVSSHQVVVSVLHMKMVSLMLISYSNEMESYACLLY